MRQKLIKIDEKKLLFTKEEIEQFFYSRKAGLSEKQIDILKKNTEGYVCALVALSLSNDISDKNIDLFRNNKYMKHFFEIEVFSKWNELTRDFLLQTCILDEFSIKLVSND